MEWVNRMKKAKIKVSRHENFDTWSLKLTIVNVEIVFFLMNLNVSNFTTKQSIVGCKEFDCRL